MYRDLPTWAKVVIIFLAIVACLGTSTAVVLFFNRDGGEEIVEVPQEVLAACASGLEAVVFEGETFQCDEVETNGGPTEAVVVIPATEVPGVGAEVPADPGNFGQPVDIFEQGSWEVMEFDLDDDPVVRAWLQRLRDPAPEMWRTFPNIPNPDVPEFQVVACESFPEKQCVPDGMEYGTYSTPYCWQTPCDIPVGAWEYRYISGDYQFLDMECRGEKGFGCMLVLVNVMDASFTWREQYVDNGFTLRGRYFNGDALEWGVWGLVSHGAANMLNMPTLAHPDEVLNSGDPGNSGANCGNPAGCSAVDVNLVVHAGDRVLAVAHTIVER